MGRPDVDGIDPGRIAAERPDQGQFVHDAAKQDVGVERTDRRGSLVTERHLVQLLGPLLEGGDHGRIDVVRRRSQPGVGELPFRARVQDRHLDRPGRAEPAVGRDREGSRHRRVVQLHVPDLEPELRIGTQPRRDRVGLRERVRERLLGEDREAAVEAGEHGRPVRAGGQDQEGVEVTGPQHVVERAVPPVRGDPVSIPDDPCQRRGQVRQRGDREVLVEPVDQGQMDGLRDRAEPENAEADRLERPAGRRLIGHGRRVYRRDRAVPGPDRVVRLDRRRPVSIPSREVARRCPTSPPCRPPPHPSSTPVSATTGGSGASSTRSIRAASPTRTATGWGTCRA